MLSSSLPGSLWNASGPASPAESRERGCAANCNAGCGTAGCDGAALGGAPRRALPNASVPSTPAKTSATRICVEVVAKMQNENHPNGSERW